MQARVGLGERAQVLEQACAVDGLALHLAVLHEIAQAADHLAGAQRLRVDLLERSEHVLDLVVRLPDQALAGLRVGGDRRQRLVDLVGEARGHLAHGRQAAEVRQALLQHARLVLGAAPVGDVVDRADVLLQPAVRAEHGLHQVVQVLDRAVAQHHLVLEVERAPAGLHARELDRDALAVGGMHPLADEFLADDAAVVRLDAEDAVQLRREVVGRAAVGVHHVVAEVGEFLRQAQLGLAASQLLLGILARGDVADEADEARRLHALHPAHREVAGEDAAVLALRPHLAADADDVRRARLVVALQVAVVLAAPGLGHQVADVAADDLLGHVAEHPLRRLAEFLDRAQVVDDDDGVDRRVQHGPVFEALPGAGLARSGATGCLGVFAGHRVHGPKSSRQS